MASEIQPLPLGEDSLHVWTQSLAAEAPAPTDSELAVLSAEELERADRYLRPEDRLLFTSAHVALRQTLSRYAPILPQDWNFSAGAHGRPEVSNADAPAGLRFNLSHTPGMIAMVVNQSFDAGVDVEGIGRVANLASVSRTSFSETEREALLALPAADQPLRFTQIWALKESFIKAMGTGLTTPLRSFSFDLSDPAAVAFDCDPEIDDDPSCWSFTVSQPSDSHVLATAARVGQGKILAIEHFLLHSNAVGRCQA